MDRRAWWATVYGVAQSRTRLSDLAAAAAAFPLGYTKGTGLQAVDPSCWNK